MKIKKRIRKINSRIKSALTGPLIQFLVTLTSASLSYMVWLGWTNSVVLTTIIFMSVLLHELGHLVALWLFGGRGYIIFSPLRARVKTTKIPEKFEWVASLIIGTSGLLVTFYLVIFGHNFPFLDVREKVWVIYFNYLTFVINAFPFIIGKIHTDGGLLMKRLVYPIVEVIEKKLERLRMPESTISVIFTLLPYLVFPIYFPIYIILIEWLRKNFIIGLPEDVIWEMIGLILRNPNIRF